jgi:hypothetical protein
MYLGSAENYLTIGGFIYGFDAGPAVRFGIGDSFDASFEVSFSFTGGKKSFTNYVQAGSEVFPGPEPFGSYQFSMFGPNARLMARYEFPKGIPIAISAVGYGSPTFENHSVVSGWSPDAK